MPNTPLAHAFAVLRSSEIVTLRFLAAAIESYHADLIEENDQLRALLSQQRQQIAILENHLHPVPHNHPVHD